MAAYSQANGVFVVFIAFRNINGIVLLHSELTIIYHTLDYEYSL